MKSIPVSSLKTTLMKDIQASNVKMEEWAKKFAVNPSYALEWIDSTFMEAARVEVFRSYVDQIDYALGANVNEEVILSEVNRAVTRQLLFAIDTLTNKSTGVGSNMMKEAKTRAYGEVFSLINER